MMTRENAKTLYEWKRKRIAKHAREIERDGKGLLRSVRNTGDYNTMRSELQSIKVHIRAIEEELRMTYDEWKSSDPQWAEPYFGTCPICKSRHWEHERCGESEYDDQDNTGGE